MLDLMFQPARNQFRVAAWSAIRRWAPDTVRNTAVTDVHVVGKRMGSRDTLRVDHPTFLYCCTD